MRDAMPRFGRCVSTVRDLPQKEGKSSTLKKSRTQTKLPKQEKTT
jgi:hypothetical protein